MAVESMSKMRECQFAMGLVHDAIKLAGSIIANLEMSARDFSTITTELSDLEMAAIRIEQQLEKIQDGQE